MKLTLLRQPFLLSVLLLIAQLAIGQQSLQLYLEDFTNGGSSFVLNDSVNNQGPTGNNQWVINSDFNGQGTYPNTITQDSTTLGIISGAPFSNYLHITDTATASVGGAANANFDPLSTSGNFAYMQSGLCTRGLRDVTLSFFYVAGGDTSNVLPNAYGELYYSIGNGPWVSAGINYTKQRVWKYETFTNPAINDTTDVRFGFLWTNNGTAQANTPSFGIDGIKVTGVFDPIVATIAPLNATTLCANSTIPLEFNFSTALCGGNYVIEFSNNSGSFSNPISLGSIYLSGGITHGLVNVTLPSSLTGGCYKFRINRLNGPPTFVGVASSCFPSSTCPRSIYTIGAVLLLDPDTICVNSVLDVPFTSVGNFTSTNRYDAFLLDPNGTSTLIGSLISSETYTSPGFAASQIPSTTTAGCGYYIYIKSTAPSVTGTSYGPFCIKECDITTNNAIDVQACVSETQGYTAALEYDIHSWNNNLQYYPGNKFKLQLHKYGAFSQFNLVNAVLPEVSGATSDTILFDVPEFDSLFSLTLLQPGYYYARIVADSTSDTKNRTGSWVRLNIGVSSIHKPQISAPDTVCNNGILAIDIDNYNYPSYYYWTSNYLNFGNPFYWNGSVLLIDVTLAPPGLSTYNVRELNFGCWGQWSDTLKVEIVEQYYYSTSIVSCLGDTVYGYTTSGTYFDTLISTNGCDTIRELNLTLNPDTVTRYIALCPQDSVWAGGAWQYSAGTYYDLINNPSGCQVYQITIVTVVPSLPVPSILRSGDTLMVPGIYDSYQWYKNEALLKGDTNSVYISNGIGAYNIIATDGSCSFKSSPVLISGLADAGVPFEVLVYPNPANHTLHIVSGQQQLSISLFNSLGQLVYSQEKNGQGEQQIDVSQLQSGVYYIRLSTAGQSHCQKVMIGQ